MTIAEYDQDLLLVQAVQGNRLNPPAAEWLMANGDLHSLGMAANVRLTRMNPRNLVGYTVSRTIVYSNVCQPNCPWCDGTVAADDPRAFTLSAEQVVAEAAEAVAAGATTIALQGGHRLDLPFDYYTGLLKALKAAFPQVQIQAYSPTEIMVFNLMTRRPSRELVRELKDAGMDVLFAGGVETLPTRAKEYRALIRNTWHEWADVVHRCADHGIPVIAPFVFGLGESVRERLGLLYRYRELQKRTSAYGKPAIISVAVFTTQPVPAGAVMARPGYPDLTLAPAAPAPTDSAEEGALREVEEVMPTSGYEYLRMVALVRLFCEGIPHVQVSPVTQGAKIAQIGLAGGADDFGGTYLEFERAELAAARIGPIQPVEVERLIRDAGRNPVQRTATFRIPASV